VVADYSGDQARSFAHRKLEKSYQDALCRRSD
jgi:hypothetical protein